MACSPAEGVVDPKKFCANMCIFIGNVTGNSIATPAEATSTLYRRLSDLGIFLGGLLAPIVYNHLSKSEKGRMILKFINSIRESTTTVAPTVDQIPTPPSSTTITIPEDL